MHFREVKSRPPSPTLLKEEEEKDVEELAETSPVPVPPQEPPKKDPNKIQKDKVKSLKQRYIELGGDDATILKSVTQGPLITAISQLTQKPKKKKNK